jgi:protein O-mannosyl-transferase
MKRRRARADTSTPESSAAARPFLQRTSVIAAGLAALVLVVYSSSFASGFVLDNDYVILKDARLRAFTLENLKAIFTTEYWGSQEHSGLYRPLTTFTYALNYAVLGNEQRPAGYHALNLLLHWANALMVFVLIRRALGDVRAAAVAAALFAVHPLATEAVTNIVGRADLMAAFFVLAALLIHGTLPPAPAKRQMPLLGALGAMAALGLLSKESAIALPGLMLAWDLAFRGETRPRRWPPYAVVVVALVAVVALRRLAMGGPSDPEQNVTDNPILLGDFWTARLTAVKVVGYYLAAFFWPSRLSCDYSFNQIPLVSGSTAGHDLHFWLALAAGAALTALFVRSYHRHAPLFFFLAFFVIALLPVSNLLFPIGTIMAERLMYLPSVGLVGAVVCLVRAAITALARWFPGRAAPLRTGTAVAVGLCLVVLGARTFRRNHDWRDELTLWTSAAQVSPNSYKVHVGHALARLRQGGARHDEVVAILEKGRAIVDPLPVRYRPLSLYHNLGVSYLNQQSYERAADALSKAIEIEETLVLSTPRERAAHALLLAMALNGLGRSAEALERIEQALPLRADDPSLYEARARALLRKGRIEEAAVSVDTAIFLGAEHPALWALAREIYDSLSPRQPALVVEHGQTLLASDHAMVRAHLLQASRELARRLVAAGRRDKAARVRDIAVARLDVPPGAFDDVLRPSAQ